MASNIAIILELAQPLLAQADNGAVEAPVRHIHIGYLGWTLLVWAISAGVLIWITLWRKRWIDEKLAKSRPLRRFFGLSAVCLIPVVAAVFVEGTDFSEIVNGRLTTPSFVCSIFLGPFVWLYLAGQYLLWHHEDNWEVRVQSADAKVKEAREDRDFFVLLNKTHLCCVERNRDRLQKSLVACNGKGMKMPGLVAAFAPNLQLCEFINTLYEFFTAEAARRNVGHDIGVRVALYRVDAATHRLTHIYSWNGNRHNCVQSPTTHPERFSLSQPREGLAVYGAVNGVLMIEEDAEEANASAESPFHYFDANQRTTIKSILVLPIPLTALGGTRYVICVDSDTKRMFENSRRSNYEKIIASLAPRLHEVELAEELLKAASI